MPRGRGLTQNGSAAEQAMTAWTGTNKLEKSTKQLVRRAFGTATEAVRLE